MMWSKLRGRTLAELRFRARQRLAMWSERARWSEQARVPDDDAFARKFAAGGARSALEEFRRRVTPRFFAAFEERESVVATLRTRWPDAEGQVLAEAERIRQGRFDLLGHRRVDFGTPVDWHLDPISGVRLPRVHWSRIDHANPAMGADVKLIWELNRHQHFVTLGKAYWYTGDERYAATFLEHLSGWMDANPPKLGINWASSLEVAFRAIAWIWALYFFKDAPGLTDVAFRRALKFLFLHGRHIETYLSTYYGPNTHLTGEALGLVYLGTVFPEFRDARRWQRLGWSILVEQLGKQVHPDGSYFEQSTYYHRYTTDFCLHASILGRLNGLPVDTGIHPTLEALLTHLMYVSQPDGRTPLIGDDDGGRLLSLDQRDRRDVRAALATGAVLGNRPDLRYVAGEAAEETVWLLGCAGLRAFDTLPSVAPAATSRAFPDGGYYVMRDHWARDASTLLVDCGPHGGLSCGHAHADALAVALTVRGVPVLVDSGSYTYRAQAGDGQRDLFRSTAAHNTLTVAGQSSSVPDGPFRWRHVARSALVTWSHADRCDYFEGRHDGYARLTPPAVHRRAVLFLRGDYWIVRDRVETEGGHDVTLHLTFAPGIVLDVLSATRAAASWGEAGGGGGAGAMEIGVFGPPGGAIRPGVGWVSECYGAMTPAPTCLYTAQGSGHREVVSFLVPRGRPDEAITIEERMVTKGRAFVVASGAWEDVVLMGGGGGGGTVGAVGAVDVTSDAAWAWVRRPRGARTPSEFVVLDGRSLTWRGRPLFRAERPVPYVAALVEGSEPRTEAAGGARLVEASPSSREA
jgi:Heparinase II/III-like protein/Heparinase II/III N-terminus